MSSITQIVFTCAFSVQVCVLRCTVQIEKEKAVKFYTRFFVFFRRVNIWCFDCFCSKGHCFNAGVNRENRGGIEGAAEACQRKCTEVLFFITKDFRLEYISVQGRVLLIYCYLMTMILFQGCCFFFTFFIGKKDVFCYICVSFS